jgi:hypothetical protein
VLQGSCKRAAGERLAPLGTTPVDERSTDTQVRHHIKGNVMESAVGRTTPALIQRGQWLTVSDLTTVLFVIHTLTYAKRLRDVFALLESDLRVQAVFTVPPHAFGQGVHSYLRRLGITVIPWEQAVGTEFDLAVAAGSQGIDQLRAPVIRMSHGAGHIKLLRGTGAAPSPQAGRAPAMLSREHLLHDGRLVPTAVALPHRRDLTALARWCPEALPAARVVGDPCYDRMLASVPRRAEYRRALGLRDGERLVVVPSTWGQSSVFERLDALLPRLLGELPAGYRIAVLAHPNVWAGHGSWQVSGWLSAARRRGVAVVPPWVPFEPLLVSADCVIGDHGSLMAYAGLAGMPVLFARFANRQVAADSAVAALAARVPALSPLHPLAEQLSYAAEVYRPEVYRQATDLLSSEPGRFNSRMRALLYRCLGIGEPAHRPVMTPAALPAPLADWTAPGAGAAA